MKDERQAGQMIVGRSGRSETRRVWHGGEAIPTILGWSFLTSRLDLAVLLRSVLDVARGGC